MDLALNNLYWLICHKTKPNQTKPISIVSWRGGYYRSFGLDYKAMLYIWLDCINFLNI